MSNMVAMSQSQMNAPSSAEPTPNVVSEVRNNSQEYEQKLSPEKEKEFWKWLDDMHKKGKIANGDYKFYKENGYGADYDFRAAFIKGLQPSENGHWNDWGKKPSHETFSDESIYANEPGVKPGKWKGNTYYPYGETTGVEY
jgi:hypothetical protein